MQMGYRYEMWLVTMVVACVVTVMVHSSGKSGCELVTHFDSYCNDGVSAAIWV